MNRQTIEASKKHTSKVLILTLALAIGFFFTRDQYYTYLDNSTTLEQAKKENTDKKTVLDTLNSLKSRIASDETLKRTIDQFGQSFREDLILDSLFTHMNGVSVASANISKGEKLPNGISIGTVSLSFRVDSITTLNSFLEYLTSDKSNKRYMIKSLSFPLDTTKFEPFSVSAELGTYYID